MFGFFSKIKRDNKGSSMLVAMVAIAFIGILAMVVTSSTVTNYKLKNMNYKSKVTFYSAESALDEIYQGLSVVCYDTLNKAYQDTIVSLAGSDNEIVNSSIQTKYNESVRALANGWINEDDVKSYLSDFITEKSLASVVSADISGVKYPASGVYIPDVVVKYKDKYGDFATVTVDLNISYPDVYFDIINDKNHLKTYLDYAMIGMDGVMIGTDKSVDVEGGVYAGNGYLATLGNKTGGFITGAGSVVNFSESKANSIGTVLIADGKTDINGTLNVNDSAVWSGNVNVDGTFITSGSYVYLYDDLNILMSGSRVNLGGEYYGYGMSQTKAENSSAIIINGINSNLNTESITKMVLAGKAYISLKNNGTVSDEYMTGDALGIKGSQEIYLVPTKYMNVSNPYAYAANGEVIPVNEEALKEFFAYDLLAEQPYTYKKLNDGAYYYYLNFKDDASRVMYVQRIINGSSTYGTDAVWKNLNDILNKSAKQFISDSNLKMNYGATITSGNLYSVSGGNMTTAPAVSKDVTAECQNKANRYMGLKYFLYDMGETAAQNKGVLTDGDGVFITNDDGTIDEHVIDVNTNVYDYVIDKSKFFGEEPEILYENNSDGILAVVAYGGDTYTGEKYVVSGQVFDCGVIIAYNTDVYVEKDFNGLIITNRHIYVNGNVTITADHDGANNIIVNNGRLAQYFKAYQNSENSVSPSEIEPEDMLTISNWRKNYEPERTSTSQTTE